MSTRDKLIAATTQFSPVKVDVGGEIGDVFVRPLSIAALVRFQATFAQDRARASVGMIIDCVCDESGKRLFTAADEEALCELPHALAEKLVDAIGACSGLNSKKAVEVAEGN